MDAGLLLTFAPECFAFLAALFDLELAENGMPADVDFVPLAFQAAQCAFAHLAQKTEGWGVGNQRMDFVPRGGSHFYRGENQFQFLHDDAFDFKELGLISGRVFFGARDVNKMVELFPALDVGFDLGDQLVELFGCHRFYLGIWSIVV